LTTAAFLLVLVARLTDSTSCQYGEWSSPRALDKVPRGSMVRDPWLALDRDRGYVVGNDVLWFDESPVRPRPFIATTLDGRDIGKPDGEFWFVRPRAVLDTRGALHVIWAEPDTHPAMIPARVWSSTRYRLTSLWSATYDPRHHWSPPTLILDRPRGDIWWRGDFATATTDSAGHVIVAVVANGRLLLLVQQNSGWRTDTLPVKALDYPEVVARADGPVSIGYIGPDPAGGASNSIMFVRSWDGGLTWLPPQAVYRAEQPAPQDVKLLAGGGDTLYLLWTGTLGGGVERGAIHLAISGDGGAHWAIRDTLPVTGAHLRAAIDGCGGLQVSYVTTTVPAGTAEPRTEEEMFAAPRRYELWYARWDGAWLPPRSPFPDFNCVEMDLRSDTGGDLFLFWSARPVGVTGRDVPFRPFVARLTVGQRP